MPRYAIDFAPPVASDLWITGSRCIGYDAATGSAIPPFPELLQGVPDWAGLMTEPARYGFFATLVAPMTQVDGAGDA